ncbi:hypothetical protein Syun_017766 [Stephania yunnanensis]|uniref:Uncharacterized protein n=1 Tax=Stephania yunnanensis TaxID=152371 RepID=A0AAP0J7I1_9MAGN
MLVGIPIYVARVALAYIDWRRQMMRSLLGGRGRSPARHGAAQLVAEEPSPTEWACTPGACAELHICIEDVYVFQSNWGDIYIHHCKTMPIYVVCPCVSRWACTPALVLNFIYGGSIEDRNSALVHLTLAPYTPQMVETQYALCHNRPTLVFL